MQAHRPAPTVDPILHHKDPLLIPSPYPWARACSRRMSVDAATWSSRLLIFFSLWLRVTAARVYSSICLRGHEEQGFKEADEQQA